MNNEINWNKFLSYEEIDDYAFQHLDYDKTIKEIKELINNSKYILIGAGSGLSTAAGITYSGKRFTDNFQVFIKKYGMTDMYSAGFYSFNSQEEKWGYWSKHALMNRFYPPALPLYKNLYELVKDKDYFVLTTNVDHQFYKAGFDSERIFATQGDYGEIQCQYACHDKVYQAEDLFYKMDKERIDCKIPSSLVPKCPICHKDMTMHLRCDNYFVEDENFYYAAKKYDEFLNKIKDKEVLLLELGVGFNTPVIIRYPFEKMTFYNKNYHLIRLNKSEAFLPRNIMSRSFGINADINQTILDIKGNL